MRLISTNSIFGIEGDLAKKIARNSPEITQDERYWLSNFQNVRDLLMRHYNTLFSGKTVDNS